LHSASVDGTAAAREVVMDAARSTDYQAFWEAIQRRACAVCLDAADDGSCGLPRGRMCALPAQLPVIVDAILCVESDHMDDYVAAIEAAVCAGCPQQDDHGRCGLRAQGDCGLYTYLPLVVDAIEEVRGLAPSARQGAE
jgi:hypothetical protein